MKKLVLFIILFLIGLPSVLAQQGQIVISGRISDKESQKGVPFALIYVKNSRICTQSNIEGYYCLKVPNTYRQASVVFSSFGYRSDTIDVNKLKARPNIKLTPGGIELRAVVVSAFTPQSVIDEALRRIPENYQCDTTLNVFFSRCCKMANDSIYLFYENMFTSCRTGYDKNQKQRRLNYYSRHGVNSNYNIVDKSRLLVFDTDYITDFLRMPSDVKWKMSYNDNLVIIDLVETSLASYALSPLRKKRKQNRYTMQEFVDNDGVGCYLVTVRRGKWTHQVTIRKDNYAITDMVTDSDTSTTYYPDGEFYRSSHPYIKYTLLRSHQEWHYRPINGKYTLVSEMHHYKGCGLCHGQYLWAGAPKEQRFEEMFLLQLVEQRCGDWSFFDNNPVLKGGNILYSDVPMRDTTYVQDYWDRNNYIPLEKRLENRLLEKLRKL